MDNHIEHTDIAKQFAEDEYNKFRIIRDKGYKSDFNRLIEAVYNGLEEVC